MSTTPGGWQIVANCPCNLPQCLLNGFNLATSTLTGATYIPLLYAAKQVVNGTNYLIIAKQTLSTQGQQQNIVEMIINESLPTQTGQCNWTVVSINSLT